MKGYKLMTVALLALVLLGFSGIANADSTNVELETISLNGIEFDSTEESVALTVYRGTELDIDVLLKGNADIDDVRVSVELLNSEYDLEVKTEKFDVINNSYYTKSLTIIVPEDMEVSGYELSVEAYFYNESGSIVNEEFTSTIYVEMSNTLEVYDLVVSPSLNIEAGQMIAANIGVKNLGEEQEDVRVYMKVPALGLSTMTTLFDLVSETEEDEDNNDYYKVHKALELLVPSSVDAGNYELVFEVVYEDGDEVVTETRTLVVNGGSVTTEDVVISVDVTSQNIVQGRGAVYKILFANVGSNTAAYTIELSDVSAWGTVRADPLTLTVSPDNNGEAYIFVSTHESSPLNAHTFTVSVLSGDSVVKEFDLTANIIESSNLSGWDEVRVGLEIGFAVLLVILVVLGIVLVAKRLGKGEDGEEPLIEEGQSYY
ncbi:hypothetical protein HOD61_00555 [archaeon]|nr:hypothetical protein [archaeon]